MKYNLISAVIPTCNPEAFNACLKDGIKYLVPIKDYITLCFVFQPQWTEQTAQQAVQEIQDLGISVKYKFTQYDRSNGIQLNRMREEAAALNPNSMLYSLIDDDFKILNEEFSYCMMRCVHYMLTHPRCGMVLWKGIPKADPTIIDFFGMAQRYILSHGLTYLNLRLINPRSTTVLEPQESIDLTGGDNERVGVAERIYLGRYPAVLKGMMPMMHLMQPRLPHKRLSMWYAGDWRDPKYLDNGNSKLIRDKYLPSYKRSVIPLEVCDVRHYIEHQGIPLDNLKEGAVRQDYTGIGLEQLIKDCELAAESYNPAAS